MSRILVIDDEPGVRDLLVYSLRRAGHEVLGSANGRQGLRQLHAQEVDLVLTDILMPEMDGIEVIRWVVRAYPRVALIAMSGGSPRLGGVEVMQLALRLGAHAVLMKPFAEADVLETVEAALAAAAAAASASSIQVSSQG